ncbi:7474_t:CDS:1, partial [Diversispora eburnea]
MTDIEVQLDTITGIPSQNDKTTEYRSLLDSILTSSADETVLANNLEKFDKN